MFDTSHHNNLRTHSINIFISPCPLPSKTPGVECLQPSTLEDCKVRAIHREISPLSVIFPIILPNQDILQDLTHLERYLLCRCYRALLCRLLIFEFRNSGDVEEEENGEEIENDICAENSKISPPLGPIHIQCCEIFIALGKSTILTIARGVRIEELSSVLRALEERSQICSTGITYLLILKNVGVCLMAVE